MDILIRAMHPADIFMAKFTP